MKSSIVFILALFFSIAVQSQKLSTQDEQEVQEVVVKFFDTLSARDSVALKKYCSADILLLERGAVWNLDSLIRLAITENTANDFRRKNSFEFINTEVDTQTAWTTYDLQSEIFRHGKQIHVHWLETVVAVKENDRWKIKLLHSTLLNEK